MALRLQFLEDGSLSKRNTTKFNKAVTELELILGVFIICQEDRVAVNKGYDTIRAFKVIHELPEYQDGNTTISRLGGLMLKIFDFRRLSDRSAMNYYNRGKEE